LDFDNIRPHLRPLGVDTSVDNPLVSLELEMSGRDSVAIVQSLERSRLDHQRVEKLRAHLNGLRLVFMLIGVVLAGVTALGMGCAHDFEFLGLEGVVLALLANVLKADALSG